MTERMTIQTGDDEVVVTCNFCGGSWTLKPGSQGIQERTMDADPPAHLVVWLTAAGAGLDFKDGTPPIIHECRNGVQDRG